MAEATVGITLRRNTGSPLCCVPAYAKPWSGDYRRGA